MITPSQPKLMKASKWAKREFESNSIPDPRTLKRWVLTGLLKGRVVGNQTWVLSSEHWGVDSVVSSAVNQLISEG